MNNINIIKTFGTIEEAIEFCGGCNRDYNPAVFDHAVKRVKENSVYAQTFRVIEHLGHKIVLYVFESDEGFFLLNKFSPFHACLSGGPLELWEEHETEDGALLEHLTDFCNDAEDRKWLARAAKADHNADRGLYVLNI